MHPKVDFKKSLDRYKAKRGEFTILDVPEVRYLTISGHGDPNTSKGYADALAVLYPVAYKLKFISKLQHGRDYVVPPLEGLWWAEDMDSFTGARDKSKWDWTMMLMVPDWLSETDFASARDAAAAKQPARIEDVRIDSLHEGTCVQTLHLGPFDAEGPVLEELHHGFIPEHGLRMTGRHHEIYLTDPRRSAPERQRTILRRPVAADRGRSL
jgi:hypothetical protein